jgi:hypothetical protein
MMKKSIKGGDGFSNWNLLGDLSFMDNAIVKIIKSLPWFVIGIILAIVGGLIFVLWGWVMGIGIPIYILGAIVAIYKSKDTKTDWLWAGAQSWYFVLRH